MGVGLGGSGFRWGVGSGGGWVQVGGMWVQMGGMCVQVGGAVGSGGGGCSGGGRGAKWQTLRALKALQSFRITHLTNAEILIKFCTTRETKIEW